MQISPLRPRSLTALLAAVLAVAASSLAAQVPVQPGAPPPAATRPVPAELELAKLIWTTMAAVDQANQSGNYSVLRDISATGFQINNDPARLAQIFATIRESRIDLSNTLLLAPTYDGPATLVQPDVFQVRGYFGLRPTAIGFDLYYQWIQGRWRLFGISITPATLNTTMPGPPPAQQQPQQQPARRR